MELDHVFVFIEPAGPELGYLKSLGLTETYRRKHPGQGTENACFCFDNIFLECLWVNRLEEIRSQAVARTGLYERSQWRALKTSPFGLAWREDAADAPCDILTWRFAPPYLPPGMAIDIAVGSDDPQQPMIFRSPGSVPPIRWPAERRGSLQHAGGFGRVLSVTLRWTRRAEPGPPLKALEAACVLHLAPTDAEISSILLSIEQAASRVPLQIMLPLASAA